MYVSVYEKETRESKSKIFGEILVTEYLGPRTV